MNMIEASIEGKFKLDMISDALQTRKKLRSTMDLRI